MLERISELLRNGTDLSSHLKETPQLPFQRIFLEDADAFEKVMPSYYKVSTPSLPFIFPQWNSLFEYLCEAVSLLCI